MSTDIALENPIELKVVDYDPSETDKEEDPDPFILFRMLLNGHRVLEEFEVKTDEIFHIKEQFESVSTTLKLIDAMNFPSYKKVREMYAPKWVPIYKVRTFELLYLTSTQMLVTELSGAYFQVTRFRNE